MDDYISCTFNRLPLRQAAIKVTNALQVNGFSPVFELHPSELHQRLLGKSAAPPLLIGFYSATLAEEILAQGLPLTPLLPWPITLREAAGNGTEISSPDPASVLAPSNAARAQVKTLRQALQSVILGPYGGHEKAAA